MRLRIGNERLPVSPSRPSPCAVACPAGVDVKSYVGMIASRRFDEALEAVRRKNPFPAICGRVCTHPCESECNRCDLDGPVAIRALKRFAADRENPDSRFNTDRAPFPENARFSCAVIGAGPAGLTAAADLARSGVAVTVYEALPRPGGMMRWSIPAYRLPRDVLDAEIAAIERLGVRIVCNAGIGSGGPGLASLESGFSAVFIATGAHIGRKMGIPGEGARGVRDAIEWLRTADSGKKAGLAGRRVVVVGGGNSAIDAARSALRLGAEKVRIAYRRSRNEMPALEEEIEAALEEGVELLELCGPSKIIADSNGVQSIECVKMSLGEPDESGRRRPLPQKGSEFEIAADIVISAVGQDPDLGFLGGLEIPVERGRIKVDAATMRAGARIFAGGDVVTGPATVIDAIAAGHRAAKGILSSLGLESEGEGWESGSACEPELESGPEISSRPAAAGKKIPLLPARARRSSFEEVEGVLDEEDAVAEASRCMRCGPCSECIRCVGTCSVRNVVIGGREGEGGTGAILVRIAGLDSPGRISSASAEGGGAGEGPLPLEAVCASFDARLCRACGKCVEACRFDAVRIAPGNGDSPGAAQAAEGSCRGCGACAAACPTGAASLGGFGQESILSRIASGGAISGGF